MTVIDHVMIGVEGRTDAVSMMHKNAFLAEQNKSLVSQHRHFFQMGIPERREGRQQTEQDQVV